MKTFLNNNFCLNIMKTVTSKIKAKNFQRNKDEDRKDDKEYEPTSNR